MVFLPPNLGCNRGPKHGFFTAEDKGRRLQGVAPRNAKERKIAKLVDELNGKSTGELVSALVLSTGTVPCAFLHP